MTAAPRLPCSKWRARSCIRCHYNDKFNGLGELLFQLQVLRHASTCCSFAMTCSLTIHSSWSSLLFRPIIVCTMLWDRIRRYHLNPTMLLPLLDLLVQPQNRSPFLQHSSLDCFKTSRNLRWSIRPLLSIIFTPNEQHKFFFTKDNC